MAYDPATGQWKDEPTSVSTRTLRLMSQDSPLMKQARTRGRQSANQRGLLNSSIGIQAAESEAYKAALPIASQEADQAQTRNLQTRQFGHERGLQGADIGSREKIAGMNVAAHEREKASATLAAFENSYSEMFKTIASNSDLPADVRDKYLAHAATVRDNNLRLAEQIWGIDLEWA